MGGPGTGELMDIIEQLRQEHEKLEFMMDELLHLQDGERNSHDYLGSFQRIIAHEGSEEEALYGIMLLNSELREVAEKGHEEQLGIRKAIEDLNSITPDNVQWGDRLSDLKGQMVAHFRTEEDLIFPQVKQALSDDDLASIGEAYRSAHRNLERPPSRIANRV